MTPSHRNARTTLARSTTFSLSVTACNTRCDSGLAKLKADGWFKALHDAGVVVGLSIGGANAHIPTTLDGAAAVTALSKELETQGLLDYFDAIDLDWEGEEEGEYITYISNVSGPRLGRWELHIFMSSWLSMITLC